MSVDVIQPTSMLPMKRARESISLSEDNVSKCGELFVTNCADKWTFYCTYCQKATTDIGVFICHVRLEHLNEQQDLLQPSRPIPVLEGNVCTIIASSLQNAQNLDRSTTGTHVESSLPSEELAANTEQETVASHIVKEEPTMAISQENIDYEPICTTVSKIVDISSLTLPASNETDYDISNKSTKKTSTTIGQESQKPVNKEIIQVIYVNEQTEDNHEEGSDTITCYASSDKFEENLTDLESHVLTHESDSCFPCQLCGKVYNSHKERLQHRKTHAEDKPFVCHFCHRRFKQQQYLTNHLKTHCQYQCNFCSKKFNSPETQRPPYACTSCVELPEIKQKIEQLNKTHALERDQNCVLATQQTTAECNEPKTAIDRQAHTPQEQLSSEVDGKNVSQVVYVKNEAVEKTEYESNNETNIEILQVNDSDSCYSPNEDDNDDTDFESTDDNEASGSKSKKKSKRIDLTSLQCPYCPAAFKSKLYTTRHIIRNHSRKLPIKCRKCQRGFFNEFGLKVHLKSHDNIHCPICKSVLIKNFFINHVLTHESDTCFPCQVCGKIFNSQNDRKRHWESHAKEKPFACNICYRRYSKLNRLTRHLKVHNQHHCNFCSISFNSSETLRAPPYVCPKCEKLPDIKQKIKDLKTFMYNSENTITASNTPATSSLNIKPVSEDVHDDEVDKTTEKNSNLEFTDKTTKALTIPIHINTNATAHKCQYCERDFYSKLGLDMHIRQSHINNSSDVTSKHKCQQCHKDFRSSSSLSHHMKTHDKKNQFQCPVCPIRKFGESSFIVHVMLHENESCFPCQVCGKIFNCNEERMTHWKCHIKERPHGCKICFRRFSQKHILQRHMKAHSQQMDV